MVLHDYMKRKHREIADDPEALCAEIGYPLVAYNAMARMEATDIRKIKDSMKGDTQ